MKRKVVTALIVLSCVLLAAACGKVDVESAAKVVVTVDSPAEAQSIEVTSSAGEVTAADKTFTVSLPDRRGAVITVSADGFKSVTLRVAASDFAKGDTLNRTVELKTKAEAVVQFTVPDVSGADVSVNGDYPVVRKGSRFTVTVPDRKNFELVATVTADDCEPREITVTADRVKSGYCFETVRLAGKGKKLFEAVGYKSSAFTRDFKLITARTADEYSDNGQTVYYQISDADVLLLESASDGSILVVRGDRLPTYGARFVAAGNVQTDFDSALRLDRSTYEKEYRLFVEQDGGYTELLTMWEYDPMTGDNYPYVCLPGACTLYAVSEWDGAIETYDITGDILSASAGTPVSLGTGQSGSLVLSPESTQSLKTKPDIYLLWQDGGYVESDKSPDTSGGDWVDLPSKRVFEGDGFRWCHYYRPATEIVFRITGDLSGKDYYFGSVNSGGSLQASYADGITTLTARGCFDDNDGFGFRLTRQAQVSTNDPDKVFMTDIGSETYYFYRSELRETATGYELADTLVYHDYVSLYQYPESYGEVREIFYRAIESHTPAGLNVRYSGLNTASFSAAESFAGNGYVYVPASAEVTIRLGAYYDGDRGYSVVTFESKTFRADELAGLLSAFSYGYETQADFGFRVLSETTTVYNWV